MATVPASATSPLGVASVQFSSDPVTVTVANTPPPPATVTRYEETDASVTYSAGWFQDAGWPWSGGTAVESMTPGEQATFTFNGTSISWSDYRGPDARTARVYLDGSFAGEVDTYSPTYGDQASVFTKTGLPTRAIP